MKTAHLPLSGSVSSALLVAILSLGGCGDAAPTSSASPEPPAQPDSRPTTAADQTGVAAQRAASRIPPREPAPVPPGNPTDTSHLLSAQTLDAARNAAAVAEKSAAEKERAVRDATRDIEGG